MRDIFILDKERNKMDIISCKKDIRKMMKAHRLDISIADYRKWSFDITEKLVELIEYRTAFTVHVYISALNNEVDTLGLIFRMFDEKKKVVVPKCYPDRSDMICIEIRSLDELTPGYYGTMEPQFSEERVVRPETIDLVIAPLLAFDRNGGRVGFGGGFYDRLLTKCKCPVIGLAYSFQEIDSVPLEEHDRRLDMIVTEKEIIKVKNG
jgi:5-formyltetrahydrofolate cyclo-ligase